MRRSAAVRNVNTFARAESTVLFEGVLKIGCMLRVRVTALVRRLSEKTKDRDDKSSLMMGDMVLVRRGEGHPVLYRIS